MDQGLLPPKKMLGKNSKSLVELRQKELELYLQTLLLQFTEAMPTLLAKFLHFHFYVSLPLFRWLNISVLLLIDMGLLNPHQEAIISDCKLRF